MSQYRFCCLDDLAMDQFPVHAEFLPMKHTEVWWLAKCNRWLDDKLMPNSELEDPNSELENPNSELKKPNSELEDPFQYLSIWKTWGKTCGWKTSRNSHMAGEYIDIWLDRVPWSFVDGFSHEVSGIFPSQWASELSTFEGLSSSGWWQLKHFLFSSRSLGKIFTHFDDEIFFKWVGEKPPTS